MHALFSDWYQVVDPSAPRETLEKRWAATEQSVGSLTIDEVAELATYVAFVQPQALSWFRATYKQHDDVMKTRGIDEEIRLLAAAVLRIAFERGDDVAVAAALSLLTGAFGRTDQPRWLDEHLNEAAQTLAAVGRSARAFAPTPQIASLTDAAEVNGFLQTTSGMIKTLRESNDFLWWALTKHSLILGEAYSALGASGRAVAAPADLIDFSQSLPLSPEAEMLLLQVVTEGAGADAKYSFKAYMGGLTRGQVQKLTRPVREQYQLLCPVLWVLRLSAEGKAWQTEFERLFKIKSSTLVPAPVFALQFLRELSLAETISTRERF